MDPQDDKADGAQKPFDPDRIGLGWGSLFALPSFVIALLMLLEGRYPYLWYMTEAAALFAAPLLQILAGVYWAKRERKWPQLVVGAVMLGLVLLLALYAAFAVSTLSTGRALPTPDADFVMPFFIAWTIAGAWALTLAAIVSRHVHLATRRAQRQGRALWADAASPVDARRFAYRLVAAFTVPLLLSAPVLLLLKYDIGLRRNANAILLQEVGKTNAQVGDLKDYEKVKAGLLTRKQIVEALEPYAAQTADVLHVFGRLPDGLQLQSVATKRTHVLFVVHAASAADEQAFVELLQQSGFRDVRSARQVGETEDLRIVATSTRADAR
jgi:Tfp pilus assembly protein PilN